MKWTDTTEIKGVIVAPLAARADERGALMECFRVDELPRVDHRGGRVCMSYLSWTREGVTRGPHEHKYQTDVMVFPGPGVFRVWLWDARKDSATYGRRLVLEVGAAPYAENAPKCGVAQVIIPPGVVHAYKCKHAGWVDEDNERYHDKVLGLVLNFPDLLYKGWNRNGEVDEIRWEEVPDHPFDMED